MTKSFKITALVVAIVGVLVVLTVTIWPPWFLKPSGGVSPAPVVTTYGIDAKNATYTIAGSPVTLVNGVSVVTAAPGSASKITTRYFGNEVVHDLNGDGRPDVAFILTQDTGGSGVFFYAVAALNTAKGYVGSEGYLLGDRIAPQATNMDEGTTSMGTQKQNVIVFNFADRKPEDSFATPPSVGKSVWLKLDPATMQFGVVANL